VFAELLRDWGVKASNAKVIVLDCGLGDTYCFKNILPELIKRYDNLILAVCYPDVFRDYHNLTIISIAEAQAGGHRDGVYRWMVEHSWTGSRLMEKSIGRELGRWEYVHHLNGNHKDNRIENLRIVTPAEHGKCHPHTIEIKIILSYIAKERLKDPTKNPMYGKRLYGYKNGMYGRKHREDSRKKMGMVS
jgi:hypothetical protein